MFSFWVTLNAYLNRFRSVKRSNHVWNACDISMVLFPVLQVFWWNSIASVVVNTSWKPLEMPFLRLLISKCPQMPQPSKTCAFGASSKAAYYSLSAYYLKTLLQPCLLKDRWRLKVFINNNTFSNARYDTNSPLYSYRWKWGWSWPCFDTILSSFLHVGKKRKEVCVKLGQPQPGSPLLKG